MIRTAVDRWITSHITVDPHNAHTSLDLRDVLNTRKVR